MLNMSNLINARMLFAEFESVLSVGKGAESEPSEETEIYLIIGQHALKKCVKHISSTFTIYCRCLLYVYIFFYR